MKLPVPENAAGAGEETEYSAEEAGKKRKRPLRKRWPVIRRPGRKDTLPGTEGPAGAGDYGRRAMEWLYMHRVTLAVIWAAGALFFLRFRLSQ